MSSVEINIPVNDNSSYTRCEVIKYYMKVEIPLIIIILLLIIVVTYFIIMGIIAIIKQELLYWLLWVIPLLGLIPIPLLIMLIQCYYNMKESTATRRRMEDHIRSVADIESTDRDEVP